MTSYKLGDYLVEKFPSLRSPAAMRNIIKSLSACNVVNGKVPLTPTGAAWIIYGMFACPSANFHTALMWVKDRRDENRQDALRINEEVDTVIYALRQLIAPRKNAEKLNILFFGFSNDGRLVIIKDGTTDILPKLIINSDNGEIENTLNVESKGLLMPANLFFPIAEKLAFTAKDLEKERKKVLA